MSICTTMTGRLSQLFATVAVAALASGLSACGGGGEAAPTATAPTGTPTNPAPSPGGAAGLLSIGATLTTGTYLEYLATTNASSASLGDSSGTQDYGLFRITLGTATMVAGVSGFSVATTGKTQVGGHEFKPSWTFIARVGTRWLGSADGQTLVTLYDPALPAATTGFFIDGAAARPLAASTGRFEGSYNVFEGAALGFASSDGGCSRVLSFPICSDTATTFSESEVLLDGIGPVAYRQSLGYMAGGSAPQAIRRTLTLELVGTSLSARNGTRVNPPPWAPAPALPVARFDARAVAIGSNIYVFGGTGADTGFEAQRVDRFDSATGSWHRMTDAPRSLAGWHATAMGTRIALFGGTEGLLYEPGTGRWTATARLIAPGTITGAGSRTRTDGRAEVVAIVDRGVAYAQATLVRYLPDVNTWQTIGLFERGPRANYQAVMQGGRFMLIGGFADGSYVSAVSSIDIDTLALTRSFAQLRDAVVQPAVTLMGGRVVVAGGYNFGGQRRSVQFIDTATGAVAGGADLLGGLQSAAAAAVDGGGLFLFGGKDGADSTGMRALDSVWAYRP
jgi:Kelch motif